MMHQRQPTLLVPIDDDGLGQTREFLAVPDANHYAVPH